MSAMGTHETKLTGPESAMPAMAYVFEAATLPEPVGTFPTMPERVTISVTLTSCRHGTKLEREAEENAPAGGRYAFLDHCRCIASWNYSHLFTNVKTAHIGRSFMFDATSS